MAKKAEKHTEFDNISFKEPIRQRQLEEYYEAYISRPRKSRVADNGAIVRTAIEAGWLVKGEHTPAVNGTAESFKFNGVEVDDLEGWQADKLARQIDARYNEAMTVPLV